MEHKINETNDILPFGMLWREPDNVDRGEENYPEKWNYDPKTQTTDLMWMGSSPGSTVSSIKSNVWGQVDHNKPDDPGKD